LDGIVEKTGSRGLKSEQPVQGLGLIGYQFGQLVGQGGFGALDRFLEPEGRLAGGRSQGDARLCGGDGGQERENTGHGIGLAGARSAGDDQKALAQGQGGCGPLPVDGCRGRRRERVPR
jgi:hypothetical protein